METRSRTVTRLEAHPVVAIGASTGGSRPCNPFWMPREAINAGGAGLGAPLPSIPGRILALAARKIVDP